MKYLLVVGALALAGCAHEKWPDSLVQSRIEACDTDGHRKMCVCAVGYLEAHMSMTEVYYPDQIPVSRYLQLIGGAAKSCAREY